MAIPGLLIDQDVADETRRGNGLLAEALAAAPLPHEADDAPAIRAARENGESVFPAPVRLPEAVDRAVPGRDGDVRVRVLPPYGAARGVLLHLHGGGWTLGTADSQDPDLVNLARAAAVAVVSVDYRLAPEHPHPAGPDDCEDAARWLVENAAAEFGTDRLAIAGESAGAHLAALTLLRLGERARAFRAAQFTYGVFDLSMTPSQRAGVDKLVIPTATMRWFYEQFLPGTGLEERRDPAISPLYADLRGLPPARFVVGTEDPLLDDSLFMAARWRAAGNAAELDIVAEGAHGFASFPFVAGRRERERQAAFIGKAVTSC
ncbi:MULTISPECIES: alpha/beta hydrolase [Actinomadura]|uniref:Alpha/beta hydrolase n=1 Tax=Actinomadura yumaensis TaxID=111807 RepID=A0ABW2CH73_9ACTN|nr:alpha/beta hydrolase [Actinomadura sp. J1-007]MWK40029.1 alpha/beta hydrolase fold domain-containing protein [Actinomadura sp. J1-007]